MLVKIEAAGELVGWKQRSTVGSLIVHLRANTAGSVRVTLMCANSQAIVGNKYWQRKTCIYTQCGLLLPRMRYAMLCKRVAR